MENANTTTPVEPAVPVQPTPGAIPQPVITSSNNNGEKKVMLWMIVGIIGILVVVGGIYLIFSKSKTTVQPEAAIPAVGDTTSTDSLMKDANAIDVASPDGEFQTVDSDLGNL